MEKDHEFVPDIWDLRYLREDVKKSVAYTELDTLTYKVSAWGLLEQGNDRMSLQKIKTGFKVN